MSSPGVSDDGPAASSSAVVPSDDGGGGGSSVGGSAQHEDDPYAEEYLELPLAAPAAAPAPASDRPGPRRSRSARSAAKKAAGGRRRLSLSGEPYPDSLDGLSLRVRGLRSALGPSACCPAPPSEAKGDGSAGAAVAGGGGGFRGRGRGSMDILRSAMGGGSRQRPRAHRHRSVDFGSSNNHNSDRSLKASSSGGGFAGRFLESASFLVSALCGLAESRTIVPPNELAGMWELTANVDTALCGIGPILSIAADADEDDADADDAITRKVTKMARLMDVMATTIRRVTDELSPWDAEIECCFGTLAELLCVTCIRTIRSACTADAETRSVSSACSLTGSGHGEGGDGDEHVLWQISGALARSWAGAGQDAKLGVICGEEPAREHLASSAANCEVSSELFVELSLLVLESLEWAPREICDVMEEEGGQGGFLAGIVKDDCADLYAAQTLRSLGNVHASMEQYEQALYHYEESLQVHTLHLGDDHYQVADGHKSMGNMYYLLGDHKAADSEYAKAITSLENCEANCPDSDATLISLMLLRSNVLSQHLGEIDEALATLGVCLEIQKASLGASHPDVADTLRKRAALYLDANRDVSAQEDFWAALLIRKAVYGDEHEIVGDTLHDMGMLLWEKGDGTTAMDLLSEALWIREQQQRSSDEESKNAELARADTQAAIASIHRATGRTVNAVPLYESCLGIWVDELGRNHEKVADAHVALGHSHTDLRDFHKARSHYLEGLAILERVQSTSSSHDGGATDDESEPDNRLTQLVFFLANLELREGNAARAREYLERFVRRKRASGQARDAECTHAMHALAAIDRAAKRKGDDSKGPEEANAGKGSRSKKMSLPKANKMRSSLRNFRVSLPAASFAAKDLMSSLQTLSTTSVSSAFSTAGSTVS